MNEDLAIFLECFVDFLAGLEASVVKMRRQISKLVGCEAEAPEKREWGWDPGKIRWVRAEGPSGEYERSEDVDNPEFKAMLKDLAEHDGRLTREGWFYWTFKNGSVVGRKKRAVKQGATS